MVRVLTAAAALYIGAIAAILGTTAATNLQWTPGDATMLALAAGLLPQYLIVAHLLGSQKDRP
ncbi:hypothetical protein AB0A95_30945 [Micromonospora sp. NPDC049230]|uniref:hypothetical protein n=1 Tax=Micromonospora sp. NPDC049230 TaxID=3155502 RepID=UPI00340CCFE3